MCLVSRGNKLEKDDCGGTNSMKWGLLDGQLSQGNGKMCVARLHDNTAVLGIHFIICFIFSIPFFIISLFSARCSEASEYIAIEVPTTYSADDLAAMLKNQVDISLFFNVNFC